MVISHEHKYVFVELPLTGSSAIRKELRTQYDGKIIHHKHSLYRTFLRHATPSEREYFSFSCIRNPMDAVVSQYLKLKNDHFDFTNAQHLQMRNPLQRLVYRRRHLEPMKFVQAGASFEDYFLRYYRYPYDSWASLSHKKLDFIIRFEHLAEGFREALRRIGLTPVRELPARNQTKGKRNYLDYYTPKTIERAKYVFGPFMRDWGYPFPASWGDSPDQSQMSPLHWLVLGGRRFYWAHLKLDR